MWIIGEDSGQNNHAFQVCQTTSMVPFFYSKSVYPTEKQS